MELANSLYLTDIMHLISQSLLTPTIILLIFFVGYSLWSIGSIVVEAFTERRNFKVQMPQFLAALAAAPADEVPDVVVSSGLLNRQKAALLTLWDYRVLPEDTHVALAKRLLASEDQRYDHISGRNQTAAKVSPMFGLMGTLIPLGPGIVALGQGDTTTLSASIGVAFDTTVCGLITAAICFVIGKIRSSWYENYMISLESAMTTILEIVGDMRTAGTMDRDEPGHAAADHGFYTKHDAPRRIAEETIAQKRIAENGEGALDGDAATAGAAEDIGGTAGTTAPDGTTATSEDIDATSVIPALEGGRTAKMPKVSSQGAEA